MLKLKISKQKKRPNSNTIQNFLQPKKIAKVLSNKGETSVNIIENETKNDLTIRQHGPIAMIYKISIRSAESPTWFKRIEFIIEKRISGAYNTISD